LSILNAGQNLLGNQITKGNVQQLANVVHTVGRHVIGVAKPKPKVAYLTAHHEFKVPSRPAVLAQNSLNTFSYKLAILFLADIRRAKFAEDNSKQWCTVF
jgi:hypothetical protein